MTTLFFFLSLTQYVVKLTFGGGVLLHVLMFNCFCFFFFNLGKDFSTLELLTFGAG